MIHAPKPSGTGTLQGSARKEGGRDTQVRLQGIPEDEAKFAATAQVLENTGVHAYLGQLLNIKTPAYALAAGTIVTIEARHSGASPPPGGLAGRGLSGAGDRSSDLVVDEIGGRGHDHLADHARILAV